MKALSLTQPWASLVANGSKRIETRGWRSSFRGELAIHAAKGFSGWAKDHCYSVVFARALWPHARGDERVSDLVAGLPLGSIVAVAQLVHVMPIEHGSSGWGAKVFERPVAGTPEYAFGDYSPRRFMWFLENVRPLREPIPCRGALSLWEVPEDVEAQILAQLKQAA